MHKLEFKECTCGGVAKKIIQSLPKKLHEFRFTVHRVPFYKCPKCHEITFDEEVDISKVSEWAYIHRIKDLIWNPMLVDVLNNPHK